MISEIRENALKRKSPAPNFLGAGGLEVKLRYRLEDELDAELQVARVGGTADNAVVPVANTGVRSAELRRVGEVERLESELRRVLLVELEAL